MDVASKPGDYSLVKLYKHLEAKPDSGGCAGEVVIDTDLESANSSWGAWFFTRFQYYEYKQTINHFKVFEGWNRFVMVLPGCYSMYRFDAVRGNPLKTFFKIINNGEEPDCWEANEYLVEDRLLTNNVYYQEKKGYATDFVMDAPCYTDAPNTLEMYLKQRRRWTNGFNFGEMTTLLNMHNIMGFGHATHSLLQKLKMQVYMPMFTVWVLIKWVFPIFTLSQIKYLLVFAAQAYFNTPEYKE